MLDVDVRPRDKFLSDIGFIAVRRIIELPIAPKAYGLGVTPVLGSLEHALPVLDMNATILDFGVYSGQPTLSRTLSLSSSDWRSENDIPTASELLKASADFSSSPDDATDAGSDRSSLGMVSIEEKQSTSKITLDDTTLDAVYQSGDSDIGRSHGYGSGHTSRLLRHPLECYEPHLVEELDKATSFADMRKVLPKLLFSMVRKLGWLPVTHPLAGDLMVGAVSNDSGDAYPWTEERMVPDSEVCLSPYETRGD